MKTRSAKNKGKRLQKEVQKDLEWLFEGILEDGDISNTIMGENGRDIKLSPLAEKYIPYDVECKNVESLKIWDAIDQAKANNKKDGRVPIVVFRKNRTEAWCALPWSEVIRLLGCSHGIIREIGERPKTEI